MAKAIKTALTAAFVTFVAFTIMGPAGLGLSLGVTATTAATVSFVTTLVAAGVGMLTSKGIQATADNFGTKFASRSPSAPRQIIYGKCRVGGTILHIQTTGTDNYLLHMIVAVAGHEVEEIESVKLNDKTLTTTTSTISGSTVYTATNADFTNTENENAFTSGRLVRYTVKNGSDLQAADGFANAQLASITASHTFKGIAYVYMQMVFDAEKFGGGVPAISFIVKGKKVYDPRTSTTAWSDNPALCIRDYLTDTRYGLKATSSEINDANAAGGFIAAANICDQTVNIPNSLTETRYTANGFTNMSANGEGILEGLLSACAGKMSYTNGKFNLFAGAAQTPSLTITDDDLLSPVQVSTRPQSGELYNTVKSVYVDSANAYQGTDASIYQDSSFLSADTPTGESSANYVKTLEVQFPFTVSEKTAQRLQRITLNANRQTVQLSLIVTTKFMRLQPNDWVYVTNSRLGYSNKVFEVIDMNLEQVGGDDVPILSTRLTLKEISSDIFDFALADYSDGIGEGTVVPTGGFTISPPENLATTVFTNNNFTVNQVNISVTWTNTASQILVGTELEYKKTTETDYTIWGLIPKGQTSAVNLLGLEVGVTYDIRIRHLSFHNTYSTYVSTQQATGGTAKTATDIDNSNVGLTVTGTTISVDTSGTGVTLDKTNVGLNDLSDLDTTQNTKLTGIEAGATVGATLGSNLRDSGSNTLSDVDVRNSDLALDFLNNTTFRIKKGTTVIDTQAFTKTNVGLSDLGSLDSTADTKLTGIETGATVGARVGTNLKDVDGTTDLGAVDVKNNQLSLGISGTTLLLNNGGGNVTLTSSAVGLNDLGDLDSTQNTKLNGIETGATVGAKAGLNLKKSDNTTLGDSDIITSQGTAASIASQGALATADTADFATQVGGTEKPADNATNNGTTINTSGNVSGSMTVASGGSITIGNITIDGTNSRILITD